MVAPSRRRRTASLLAGGLALAALASTAAAQQPRSRYQERAALFDPAAAATRFTGPSVRERPVTHRSYFADQRSGQYQSRIPSTSQGSKSRVGKGRFNVQSLVRSGMGGGVPYGGGRSAGPGTYGGARPR